MSSKRKWDQPGPAAAEGGGAPEETKTARQPIAAKIAAQFAEGLAKDAHEADYSKDIDINDVRNRYMLTKGSTQQEIHEDTGASVSTKGTWYPDRSKATEKDPPLYLHVTAPSPEVLQKAIDHINQLIAIDLGSLVEDKKDRLREKRKWPEEKLPVGLESIRNFHIRAKVVGPQGQFVKYIQQETGTRVQVKGIGSAFLEPDTGRESDEPLYIHITGPEEGQVARAKVLTEDLLLVVRAEHAKMAAIVQQQQMELHQAQMQYAAYSTMAGYGQQPPPPPSGAPPPPPGDQPPPPPGGASGDPPAPGTDAASTEAYAQYWAAYGYDVNSSQFKEWAASQQQQYGQYYAGGDAQGYNPVDPSAGPAPTAPAPQEPAPPPPPPPQ
ncbi:uncharacterized protein EV420DRAFT_1617127 [Desarmillaria tabescens]|uniref:K Homology domain-containing protein n=1 Tax=Armillaria tabescens TaxID=1929756 RepID=A0AA39TUH9_ARMTA|nr:uncharacterized protein EV420DRAFT_1617127 [Desarmillaria tabescens]KAK0466843.1 hypothetical protein EV420DRAFT_1617127 [Desarmillaria tabescens]